MNRRRHRRAGQASRTKVVELDEILVTGSRIRGAQNSASPLVTFEREDIGARASARRKISCEPCRRSSLAALLDETIAGLFGGEGSANNLGFGTGLNLRGLGTKSTLVLLDGNRLAPSGTGEVVDISVIPLAALRARRRAHRRRVAIYGADAGRRCEFHHPQEFRRQ